MAKEVNLSDNFWECDHCKIDVGNITTIFTPHIFHSYVNPSDVETINRMNPEFWQQYGGDHISRSYQIVRGEKREKTPCPTFCAVELSRIPAEYGLQWYNPKPSQPERSTFIEFWQTPAMKEFKERMKKAGKTKISRYISWNGFVVDRGVDEEVIDKEKYTEDDKREVDEEYEKWRPTMIQHVEQKNNDTHRFENIRCHRLDSLHSKCQPSPLWEWGRYGYAGYNRDFEPEYDMYLPECEWGRSVAQKTDPQAIEKYCKWFREIDGESWGRAERIRQYNLRLREEEKVLTFDKDIGTCNTQPYSLNDKDLKEDSEEKSNTSYDLESESENSEMEE
ncbi:hypothetical protein Ddc_15862 [Ditylenchus destructor]|nr:hypothetical protein Ddc_15862 [Ditylenchus destructor]